MLSKKIKINLAIQFLLLILSLLLIHYSNIDLAIQQHLFDFETQSWLVERHEPIRKFFFYKLPKILFGIFLTFALLASYFSQQRKKFLLIALGLIFIPLIAGNIKKFTNIYCPAQLEIYGGDKPYAKIFEKYPDSFHRIKKGKCFPAGHAITGFAFFILFFALEKKSYKIAGLIFAISFGWIVGFYQMARGEHFFGDTLVAMQVAFLLAYLIANLFQLHLAKRSSPTKLVG